MAVTDVTEKTFVDEVLMAPGLVVVDYWADWCAPCKQLSPIIDELATEFGEVKFVKVDTNTNPNLAAEQGVLSLPTLQFFQGKDLPGGVVRTVDIKKRDSFLEGGLEPCGRKGVPRARETHRAVRSPRVECLKHPVGELGGKPGEGRSRPDKQPEEIHQYPHGAAPRNDML